VLPFTTFAVASWLLGWQLQPVLSGSMEPTYPVGSLLVVGQVDPADVEPAWRSRSTTRAGPGGS
jgi:signal peptidase I